MSEIKFRIPKDDPSLEAAIAEFIQAEFQQTAAFKPEQTASVPHKGLVEIAVTVAVVVATLEGNLQFVDRVKRMERVKKMLAAVKASGKPVYLKIRNKSIELANLPVDDVMNFLANKKDEDEL